MYDWTKWLDHVTSPSNRFNIVKNDDGTYTITPASTVMQEGTPQDQEHFNNMEGGILDAHITAGLIFNALRQLQWDYEENAETFTGANLLDMDIVVRLVMNLARQNHWDIEDIQKWIGDHDSFESGTVTLTNSQNFPFNNSKRSVSLNKSRNTTNYVVLTEVTSFTGNVGEIEVSDKLVNGFKIAHTGSASSVTVKYVVIGGFEA